MMTNRIKMLTLPVGPRDHIIGRADAPVTVVEYGDYECPFCGAAHKVVGKLIHHMPSTMRYVFRHFPLAKIHPHAQQAAEAAEAAAAQGKFWDMHNMLFTNQLALDLQSLVRYAGLLQLNLARFTNDLAKHTYALRVREDFMSGIRSGVNGTPTFFINGVRHDESYDMQTLSAAIQAAANGVAAPTH
jgi:protein-disulfide isomerase